MWDARAPRPWRGLRRSRRGRPNDDRVPWLLNEVDEGEDHDPDDVDEVPVQRAEVNEQRVLRTKPALPVDEEQRHQPQHAGADVRAVEAREREERRPEEVGLDREALVDE